jgi:hypothetical protein
MGLARSRRWPGVETWRRRRQREQLAAAAMATDTEPPQMLDWAGPAAAVTNANAAAAALATAGILCYCNGCNGPGAGASNVQGSPGPEGLPLGRGNKRYNAVDLQ